MVIQSLNSDNEQLALGVVFVYALDSIIGLKQEALRIQIGGVERQIAKLQDNVESMNTEMKSMNKDLKNEMKCMNTEMKSINTEMKNEMKCMRTEMKSINMEVNKSIHSLTLMMNDKIAYQNERIARMEGQMKGTNTE